MTRYGIAFPFGGLPLSEHRRVIEELPDLGYADVWTGEAAGHDGITPLALASAWAPSLGLGTAVLPVQTRGPALLAMTAATLAMATSGRVVLGIGSSGRPFVEDINGIPFGAPYEMVRDTLSFLRRALSGEFVEGDFNSFAIQGFQLDLHGNQRPKIMVGALRPRMLRLATSEADGVIMNLVSVADVAKIVDSLGPLRSGVEIASRIHVFLTTDRQLARQVGRRFLAPMLAARTYSAAHEWLGRSDEVAAVRKARDANDWAAAQAAISDATVDGLIVHGSADSCREHIQQFVEAGVATPILVPLVPHQGNRALAYRQVTQALRPNG